MCRTTRGQGGAGGCPFARRATCPETPRTTRRTRAIDSTAGRGGAVPRACTPARTCGRSRHPAAGHRTPNLVAEARAAPRATFALSVRRTPHRSHPGPPRKAGTRRRLGRGRDQSNVVQVLGVVVAAHERGDVKDSSLQLPLGSRLASERRWRRSHWACRPERRSRRRAAMGQTLCVGDAVFASGETRTRSNGTRSFARAVGEALISAASF